MAKRTIPFDIGDEVVISGVIENIRIGNSGIEDYTICIHSDEPDDGEFPYMSIRNPRVVLSAMDFKLAAK